MKKMIAAFITISMFIANPFVMAQPMIAPAPVVMQTAAQVGVVAAVQGSVKLKKPGQVGRVVESGEPVYRGDIIETDGESTIQLLLMDETIFTIGPNSSMTVESFDYDAASADGQVTANVIQGAFRMITGKVGQKKPSNVKIKLPVGVMAVRGTMVYLKVDGDQTTGILGGPGEQHNTKHRIGKFIMQNEVQKSNGEVELKETYVTKPGNASRIDGRGLAPTGSFAFPESEYTQLKQVFATRPEKTKNANASTGDHARSSGAAGNQEHDQSKTVTERSGQAKASGLQSLKQVGRIGGVNNKFDKLLGTEGADRGKLGNNIPDGLAKVSNLTLKTGQFHYEKMSTISGGSYTFKMDIDFGAQKIGGGNSGLSGSSSALGGMPSFNFAFLPMNFNQGLGGDAIFEQNSIFDSNCGSGSGCNGKIKVELLNGNGNIAEAARHIISIESIGGATIGDSGVSASRDGFST